MNEINLNKHCHNNKQMSKCFLFITQLKMAGMLKKSE